MPLVDDIRGAIVTRLGSVTDIGIVNDYERFAKAESDFRNFYMADIGGVKQIRGWNVRRTAMREVNGIHVGTIVMTWAITGYLAIEDSTASEKVFDVLIESACAAFRAEATLGGVVTDICDLTDTSEEKESGLQLRASEPVLLGGVLCHRARLALITSIAIQF